jgi:hypothetical protein
VIALAAAGGIGLFLLSFALGWSTEGGAEPLPRAVPLAAKPTAVAVTRLAEARPLPALRAAPRARRQAQPRVQRQARTTTARPPARRAARPAVRTTASPPRRRAPRPVTIVGTG